MSLTFALAIYLICWWLVLFTVLPLGIRSQQEEGEVVEGSEAGAPHQPRIWRKLLITTIVATIIFAIIYVIIAYRLITLDEIPFLPAYERL